MCSRGLPSPNMTDPCWTCSSDNIL
ncbi:hypothetical protein Nmel_016765, partial [Mimus melanotis]